MGDFDFDYNITNPNTLIFSGELDKLVKSKDIKKYLDSINYKYKFRVLRNIGHSVDLESFKLIFNKIKY